MREDGLRAIKPPKFIPRITDNKHGKRVCPNLLLNQPKTTKHNQVWVSDIIYMPLKNSEWWVPPKLLVYLVGLIHTCDC